MVRLVLSLCVACVSHLVAAQEALAVPSDMGCTAGPRSVEWGRVKQRFRSLFEGGDGPFKPVPVETIASTLSGSVADLEPSRGLSGDADAVVECGIGKLFIKLLALAAVEDPQSIAQYFTENSDITSPIMTMLLDIPWASVAQSGWPFFGVLAQINYQKVKVLSPMLDVAAIDGLVNEPILAYFELMMASQQSGDMLAMAAASEMYLRDPPEGSPYAGLTAMASRAAFSMDVQERLQAIGTLQDAFKQALREPSELDIALTIRWPLWGFLHVCIDVFAEAP